MNQTPPVTFSLRIPAELAAELDKMALTQKRSRSNLARMLLTDALLAKRASLTGDGAPRVTMGGH